MSLQCLKQIKRIRKLKCKLTVAAHLRAVALSLAKVSTFLPKVTVNNFNFLCTKEASKKVRLLTQSGS